MEFKHGKVIHSQAREIIANVIRACDAEAANNTFVYPLVARNARAAYYTGVSERTISKIRKEDKDRQNATSTQPLASPGKKRSRPSVIQKIDGVDFSIIRRMIEKFYCDFKVVPTCSKLLIKLKEEMEFPFGKESLRLLLKAKGFYWRKCHNKRKLLMERPSILHWRYKYLRSIKKFREEGRHIIYLDETWVDNDLTFKKCWQSEEIMGVLSNISSTGRLIIVHAGSQDGFVPGACLIFKAGCATGDYHGQMNQENFTKWLTEKLFPNIPPNSIIIMDNAPYHSALEDKPPTRSSLKRDIITWLSKKGIEHDPNAKKMELYEIACLHRPPSDEKNYKIDNLIRSFGHTPLRTPPYMCQFNPIEMIWAQVKFFIRSHNTSGEFTIKKLDEISNKAIASVSASDWQKVIGHVIKIEDEYWEKDSLIQEIQEEIIINIGGESDSNDSSSDSDHDSNQD